MEELENKELCKSCGGKCCKAGGCLWFPSDFKTITLDSIDELLKDGSSMIVGTPNVVENRGKFSIVGVSLSLRARNVGKGPIDLISLPTQCASLTEAGCKFDFEHRPSGGKHYIPYKDENGELKCHEDFEVRDIEKEWYVHNKILSRLVKRYTGLSPMEEYRKEVIEYLYTWLTMSEKERMKPLIEDYQVVTDMLVELFPEEVNECYKRLDDSSIRNLKYVRKHNFYI